MEGAARLNSRPRGYQKQLFLEPRDKANSVAWIQSVAAAPRSALSGSPGRPWGPPRSSGEPESNGEEPAALTVDTPERQD